MVLFGTGQPAALMTYLKITVLKQLLFSQPYTAGRLELFCAPHSSSTRPDQQLFFRPPKKFLPTLNNVGERVTHPLTELISGRT